MEQWVDSSVCFLVLCLFWGFAFEKLTVLKLLHRLDLSEDVRQNALKKAWFHLSLCFLALPVLMFSDYQRGLFGPKEMIIAFLCGYWMAYVYVLFLLGIRYKWLFLLPILFVTAYISGCSAFFLAVAAFLAFRLRRLQQKLLKETVCSFMAYLYQNYIKNNQL